MNKPSKTKMSKGKRLTWQSEDGYYYYYCYYCHYNYYYCYYNY